MPSVSGNVGAVASVSSVFGRNGGVVAANGDYSGVVAAHLTGATAATRYVGGTASGAPVAGTFAVGDFVIEQTGKVYVCTVAGTPGTWVAPGGASSVMFVGPITVNYTDTADFSNQKVIYALPAGGAALIDAKAVVKTAFAGGITIGQIGVGGADYATGDFWTAFGIFLTDDGEFDADSAQFIPATNLAAVVGAIAFTGPGAVTFQIDPSWTAGQVDLYLLVAVPTAP